MTLNCIWYWGSYSGALGNVEYHFIAITPRSTLTRSGRTRSGLIYASNKSILELVAFDRNTWNHSAEWRLFLLHRDIDTI